ncbi:MAG: hypothetical protein OXS29_05635 [bacterium]|nr:hypothetical protein [bacterium]MDE0290438.1 hypothetical protein [bacterium]MDE0437800.1 hypothetical protein [bacterium]
MLKLVKWIALIPMGLGIVLLFFALIWRTWGQAVFAGVLILVSGLWIAAFARIERRRRPVAF